MIILKDRMKKAALLFLICTLAYACGNKGTKEVEGTSLIAQDYDFVNRDSLYMKFPYKVYLSDSLLFVLDLHAPNGYYINAFTYPDLEYVNSFALRGNGPDEVLGVANVSIVNGEISLIDHQKSTLFSYSIQDIRNDIVLPQRKHKYDIKHRPLLTVVKTEDGLFYVSNANRRDLVGISDSGEQRCQIGLQSQNDQDEVKVPGMYVPSLWNSVITYDSALNIVVVGTKLGDVLEIYNISSDSLTTIMGEGGYPGIVKRGNSISVGRIDGFSDIVISGNRIYALFSGADREELAKKWAKGESTPDGGNNIFVYDTDGRLADLFHLDRYINGFTIDSSSGIIIGVSSNRENPFSKFELPRE